MKRFILPILTLLFTHSFSNAYQVNSGAIKVIVLDENDDDFLGANVKIFKNNIFIKGNSTDPYGLAVISNIDPGRYLVEVTAIGYATYKETITVYSSNITSVNCQLQTASCELSEVIVEERRPLIKESYGGMNSKNSSAVGRAKSSNRPVIRGGRSNQTITYIDGMPVRQTIKEEHTIIEKPKEEFSKTLTAGELNDFNKFDLWNHLSKSMLNEYVSDWDIELNERYTVCLKNLENRPIINAKVDLIDEKGKSIWSGCTNNAGRVELWGQFGLSKTNRSASELKISYAGEVFTSNNPILYNQGINQIQLPVSCFLPENIDIAFVVDATGSMHDEISYLKDEMGSIVKRYKDQYSSLKIRTASVFYKDYNQEYVTSQIDFTEKTEETISFIKSKSAGGGGSDYMEAVDTALLTAIRNLKWQEEARARVLFLMLDAPPHKDRKSVANMKLALKLAAKKGIRIVPIVCSGSDKSNEYIMRSAALATNGTYLFLTDHSGVGSSHLKPSTDSYDVNYLNDLMLDVLDRFTTASVCVEMPNTIQNAISKLEIIATETNDTLKQVRKELNDEITKIVQIEKISTKGELDKPIDKTEFDDNLIIEGSKFSLYPNPATTTINVSCSKEPKRVLLLDASGKMLREFNNPMSNFSIQLNDYNSGIYFVALVDENEKSKIERFIVRK